MIYSDIIKRFKNVFDNKSTQVNLEKSILIKSSMVKKGTHDSKREKSILVESSMAKQEIYNSIRERSILVESSLHKNDKQKTKVLIKTYKK